MKLLVTFDRNHDERIELEGCELIDLRNTSLNIPELMDVYESIEPELIQWLRKQLADMNPDAIIAVGKSDEYRWIGTIVCRVCGQFNSWNGQRQNSIGVTELTIQGKSVKLIAIDSFDDFDRAQEMLLG